MLVDEKLRETEEAYVTLAESYDQLQDEYDALLDQHKLIHVIAAILIEEQGGLVHIADQLLTGYDLRTQIQLRRNDGEDVWNVLTVAHEEDE